MLSRRFLMGFDAALVVILLAGLLGLLVELAVGGDEWGVAVGLAGSLLFLLAGFVLSSESMAHMIKKSRAAKRNRAFACGDEKTWHRLVVGLVCEDLEELVLWMKTSDNATLNDTEVAAMVRVAVAFRDYELSDHELRTLAPILGLSDA